MTYLVALLSPPHGLQFKHPCSNGEEITIAVRRICDTIEWDPTEHYEDFWETIGDTGPLDAEQVAFIDLWDSNLIASLIIGRPDAVIKTASDFEQMLEAEKE